MSALSIRWRFLLLNWLLIVIVAGLFSGLLYSTQKYEYLKGIDAKLSTGALMARRLVGADFHDRLISTDSLTQAEFLEIVTRYNLIARETGFQYLWSNLILPDGRIVFSTATSSSKDATRGDHAAFFSEHSDPAAFDAVRAAGKPTFSTFENEWGKGRMLLAPYQDAQGRTYIFGASIAIDELDQRLAATRWKAVGVFLAMLALGALVSLALGHLTVRPLQRLRFTTEAIAGGAYGTAVKPEGGGEEIESMAASVNSMSRMIKHNVDELQTLLLRQRLFARMFEFSGEAMMITDQDNRIVEVNPAFTQLTGYAIDDVSGADPRLLSSGRTLPETYQSLWASLKASGHWQGEMWDRHKNGHIYPKWASISAILDEGGAVSHYIASFTDISERKAAEERIDYLAHHDVLTGLPNRFSLEVRLDQAILTARRDHKQLAVIFIDLDRFKVINDTLGHHVGDQLLTEVARRLRHCVRESDIVARLGGDEFVIVLSGIAIATDAASVANKVLRHLVEPYQLDGHALHSSPSVGISLFPGDGDNAEALMKAADTAMYHAKDHGRNNAQFYTKTMNAELNERMVLERDLRLALQEGQFEVYYQPQVCTHNLAICGVEALVRWRHPEHGLIPPLKFIPIAEDAGLIEELGGWVLDEACRQFALWRTQGIEGIRVAVNLSAHQLRSPELIDTVARTMHRHGMGHGDLELEVTESVAMADPEHAIARLEALREMGVELAIDDFGTGYSSLAYLKLLPIQTLKLDRSFVKDIESNENGAAISTATIALAHSLGLKVVAEGVETEAQSRFLAAHSCDFLQGYRYGRPEPAAMMEGALPHGTGTEKPHPKMVTGDDIPDATHS
jgi:diguanylate cyclase (GGDEF)-like protein/PAS domain S-box-containing protein